MSRASALLLLFVLSSCWKENPSFIELESSGTTQIGTASATSATTSEPTTVASVSSTGSTGSSTTSGISETSATSGTTVVASTGAACTDKMLEIQAADDTFLVNAIAAGKECTLYMMKESFAGAECMDYDFGTQPVLSLTKGPDPSDPLMKEVRISVYLIRFERDANGLLLETAIGPAIPFEQLQSAQLKVAFMRDVDAKVYSSVTVDLFALPSPAWIQGPGGSVCQQKAATFACSACTQDPNCPGWVGGGAFDLSKLTFVASTQVEPSDMEQWLTFDLDLKWFGGGVANEGFVLVASSGVIGGAEKPVDPGSFQVATREYADNLWHPVLAVTRCQP